MGKISEFFKRFKNKKPEMQLYLMTNDLKGCVEEKYLKYSSLNETEMEVLEDFEKNRYYRAFKSLLCGSIIFILLCLVSLMCFNLLNRLNLIISCQQFGVIVVVVLCLMFLMSIMLMIFIVLMIFKLKKTFSWQKKI